MKNQHERYLTPDEKHLRLTEWNQLRFQPRPSGDLGGRGYPDPDIFPLCDALNALPGVCTIQSCAGHLKPADRKPGATHVYPAILWIRLNEKTAGAFDARIFELADDRVHFEEIQKLYSRGEGEILSLAFRGNECGMLEESAGIILEFLNSL